MSHDAPTLQRPEQGTQIADASKEDVSMPKSDAAVHESSTGTGKSSPVKEDDRRRSHSRSKRRSSRSRERTSRARSSRSRSRRDRDDRRSSHRSRSRSGDRKSRGHTSSRKSDRDSSRRRSRSRDRHSRSRHSSSRHSSSRHKSSRSRHSRRSPDRKSSSRRRRRSRSRSSSTSDSSDSSDSSDDDKRSQRKRSRKGSKKAKTKKKTNPWKELLSGRVGAMPASVAATLQKVDGMQQGMPLAAPATQATAAAGATVGGAVALGVGGVAAAAGARAAQVVSEETRQSRTLVVRGLATDVDFDEFKVFFAALLASVGIPRGSEPASKCILGIQRVDLRPELAREKARAIAARVAAGGPIEAPVAFNSTKLLEGGGPVEAVEEERVEIELRSPEEANAARHLTGVPFLGADLELAQHPAAPVSDLPRLTAHQVSKLVQLGAKVGRLPSGEDPSTRDGTVKLGKQLAAITVRGEGRSWPSQLPTTTVAILDIPGQLSENDVQSLAFPFGEVAVMEVSDADEAGLKVAMVMYCTDAVATSACEGLHNTPIGHDHLIVRKAATLGNSSIARLPLFMELAREALYASWPIDERPSKCVLIDNMVTMEETRDDAERADIAAELKDELATVGVVEDIRIPTPKPGESDEDARARGVGLILVRMSDVTAAARVTIKMAGRMFDGRELKCTMYPDLLWAMDVVSRDLDASYATAKVEADKKEAAEKEAARLAAEASAAAPVPGVDEDDMD